MTDPIILSIDTSCDETAAAVTCGRRVLSNIISSQIDIHQKYGGVFPALAKRAHQERIDPVVSEALIRARVSVKDLSAIAVTYGPGLAIALEVGIRKAKELALANSQPLLAVNHMEGHIYSTLAQNRNGKPEREIEFPALCLLVSGGHTELVTMTNHGQYQVLGQTLDDAAGEALDKAARILKLGYPGGPIIERLAEQLSGAPVAKSIKKEPKFQLNPALIHKKDFNFSYSGLKTQFFYLVEKMSPKELGSNLEELAASFQEATFEQLIRKTSQAIEAYHPKALLCGGGVVANKYLRVLLRRLVREYKVPVYFPTSPRLIGDNAAMIGIAANFKYQRKEFVKEIEILDRIPRLSF
jgi:N6-L-threonylcarbamoyladenine synthase